MERDIPVREAVKFLNVSESYVLHLLDSGKLASRLEGEDRRIASSHAVEYKAYLEAEAERAYSELVQQAQDLRMGYG